MFLKSFYLPLSNLDANCSGIKQFRFITFEQNELNECQYNHATFRNIFATTKYFLQGQSFEIINGIRSKTGKKVPSYEWKHKRVPYAQWALDNIEKTFNETYSW